MIAEGPGPGAHRRAGPDESNQIDALSCTQSKLTHNYSARPPENTDRTDSILVNLFGFKDSSLI